MAASDAEYIIDIAAKMDGGYQTSRELDELTKGLVGVEGSTDSFETAIKQLSGELKTAKQNMALVSQELSEAQADYKLMERTAVKASRAVERAIKRDGEASAELVAELDSANAALTAQASKLQAVEARTREAAAAEESLGAQLANTRELLRHTQRRDKEAERAAAAKRAEAKEAERAAGIVARAAERAERARKEEAKEAERAAGIAIKAAEARVVAEKKAAEAVIKAAKAEKAALTRRVSVFRGALGDVGGPIGELGERLLFPVQAFVDLNEEFGASRAAATIAGTALLNVAAILAIVAAGAALLTAAMGALASKLADTKREADLSREALEAMDPSLASLRGTFTQVTQETGLAADALRGLRDKLQDAKVSAEEMPRALRAAALAEKALGAGGADKFIKDIREGKLTVDQFANTTQQKLGGIVERQMLGLGAQATTLKRNLSGLFGGLEIEEALKGFRVLVNLFDQTTASGQAMKLLFEAVFQPLIDQVKDAAVVVEAFALGFLIELTKIYIRIKPVIKAISEFFGFEDFSLLDLLDEAEYLGGLVAKVFVGFGVVLGVVAGAIGVTVAAAGALTAGLIELWSWVFKLAGDVGGLFMKAWEGAREFFSNLDMGAIGRAMLEGLAAGITGAAGIVTSAVRRAMKNAIGAAKSALGIASPSKVFAEFGGFTGEGYAEGIEKTSGRTQGALAEMVAPPMSGTALSRMGAQTAQAAAPALVEAAAPATGGGGGGGAAVDFSGSTFNFYGVEGAEDAQARIEEVVTKIIEGDAIALGAGRAA